MSHEASPLVNEDETAPVRCSKRTWILVSIGALVIIGAGLGVAIGVPLRNKHPYVPEPPPTFPNTILDWRLEETLMDLQSWGSRAPGAPGALNATKYLKQKLSELECEMSEDIFSVPVYKQTAPSAFKVKSAELNMTFEEGNDFIAAEYSGSGSLVDVPMTRVHTSGCDASDWATFPTGHAAMLDLNLLGSDDKNCSFTERATRGQTAGASAVIFRMYAPSAKPYPIPLMEFPWYEGMSFGTAIPVIITSSPLGMVLLDSTASFTVTLETHSTSTLVQTQNTYCDSKTGDPSKMIVFGAHFDSVPAGPGANDNGSGSSTLLEILTAWSQTGLSPTVNKLRFAWWGAEELGLLGSFHFVKKANDSGLLENVKVYVNMDMLGSKNGYIQVHHPAATTNPNVIPHQIEHGCTYIAERILSNLYLWSRNTNISAFEANSDYYPFVRFNVASSGVGTGAGEKVNAAEAVAFGLDQNAPMDSCYHQSCDVYRNVRSRLHLAITEALAHTLHDFATDTNLIEHLQGTKK